MENEKILYEASISRACFLVPIIQFCTSLLVLFAITAGIKVAGHFGFNGLVTIPLFLIVVGIFAFSLASIAFFFQGLGYFKSRIFITESRLIKDALKRSLRRIDEVELKSSRFGNYGQIIIKGGGNPLKLPYIENAEEFKEILESAKNSIR